jgi:uncharacterized surface protein with fasciclin (FAS1) repeats
MLTAPLLLLTTLTAAPLPAAAAPPALDILDVAEQAGTFNTLAAALEAADLVDVLRGDGPFTVFAPTDEAFAQLPAGTVESLLQPGSRDTLIAVLTYHVVPGRISALDAVTAGSADSLQGAPLDFRIEGGTLRVGDARVQSNDVPARNGVIHVIDSVLLPPAPEARAALGPMDILVLAIERGAPLFNDGQPAACTAIYELACRAVLDLGADRLPADAARALERALVDAGQLSEASLQAWALRGGMDDALRVLSSHSDSRASASRAPRVRDRVLFDFSGASDGAWPSVNDDVMGGISRGASRTTDNGTFLFVGALSLENNGGFSTVRSPATDLGLSGWDGLVMRVRGDGRSYNVSAMTDDRRGELHRWEMPFDTEPDEWIEVRVPFDDLDHRVMGWTIPDGPINPATIRSLAFGISDKNTQPFALEIDWIKTYRAG